MVSHWLWCLCRHAFQVGPVCLHVCGFSLIKLSARLARSQVALVVTALSSRRLLLVVEIVEVVEEIVERVAAEITSCSTVVTALTTELSTWLPRTLQLVPARASLGPTTLPKKYRNKNTQKYKQTETQIHTIMLLGQQSSSSLCQSSRSDRFYCSTAPFSSTFLLVGSMESIVFRCIGTNPDSRLILLNFWISTSRNTQYLY